MKSLYDKEDLFEDFWTLSQKALGEFESFFDVPDVAERVLGDDPGVDQQKARLRATPAWTALSALFDFALLGRMGGREAEDLVIDGASVLALVSTEQYRPDEAWSRIVAMGDARFALDAGDDIELSRVALLAHVDVRTVRNAVSQGELLAHKADGLQFIDNASARRWLAGRRAFKATEVEDGALNVAIGQVATPAAFAALLQSQRKRLALGGADARLTVLHPLVSQAALAQLEAGVFALPLDAVFPLAHFYQIPQQALLACVMRVFFRDELNTIMTAFAGATEPA